jgi:hypothetical protein
MFQNSAEIHIRLRRTGVRFPLSLQEKTLHLQGLFCFKAILR